MSRAAKVSRTAGQGAPRTCRCIETSALHLLEFVAQSQGAPRTCRCIETGRRLWRAEPGVSLVPAVREHHAPVGALRLSPLPVWTDPLSRQGAPRTCRCIETLTRTARGPMRTVREHHAPVGALRRDEPSGKEESNSGQGAPRTCRCIETTFPLLYHFTIASLTGAFVCAHIGIAVAGCCDRNSQRSAAPHLIPTHSNTVLPPGARPRCRRW